MPPDPTQPRTVTEPATTPVVPQSAPVIDPVATQSPTEPAPLGTAETVPTTMPPVAPEAPTSPVTIEMKQMPTPPIPAPEAQNPPSAPVIAPVEPPPSPSPAPQPSVITQASNPRSFIAKALEKIQFRKRAKLEKIVKLATEKKSITNDQVQKLLYVSDATASRYLLQLVKDGKLRKLGPDGRARYEPVSGSLPTN